MKAPGEWKKVKFGEVVKHIKERIPNRDDWTFDRYISGEHIDNGEICITRSSPIEGNEEVIGSAFHMRFKPGQVLYVTRRGYLRKSGIVDIEGICSNVTFTLETDEKQLLQILLPFLMQTENFVEHATSNAHGSTNPFLNWKDIAKYEFLLPTLEDQKKICDVLWSVEENIKETNILISQLELVNRIVLADILKELTDYKMTPLKDVLLLLKDGTHILPKKQSEGIPIISALNIDKDIIDFTKEYALITKEDYDSIHKNYVIEKGDVLFTTVGTIGRVAIVDTDKIFTIQRSIGIFKPNYNLLNSKYLFFVLKSKIFLKQLRAKIKVTAQPGIYLKELGEIKIPLITVKEQLKIVTKLEAIKTSLDQLYLHLTVLKNLRNKLSNELLSGNLRLE